MEDRGALSVMVEVLRYVPGVVGERAGDTLVDRTTGSIYVGSRFGSTSALSRWLCGRTPMPTTTNQRSESYGLSASRCAAWTCVGFFIVRAMLAASLTASANGRKPMRPRGGGALATATADSLRQTSAVQRTNRNGAVSGG